MPDGFFLGSSFYSENGSQTVLQNIGGNLLEYMA
jgi:hypothetical protein